MILSVLFDEIRHRETLTRSQLTSSANDEFWFFRFQAAENLEQQVRSMVTIDHKNKAYKLFGHDSTSTNKMAIARAIKLHSKDMSFRASWLEMAKLNQGIGDPLRQSESVLSNLLRIKGLLAGPTIIHYPTQVHTRNWADIMDNESFDDPPPLTTRMASAILQDAPYFWDCHAGLMYKDFPVFCDPVTQIHLLFTQEAEQAFRSCIVASFLKEHAQITGSPSCPHCTLASHGRDDSEVVTGSVQSPEITWQTPMVTF